MCVVAPATLLKPRCNGHSHRMPSSTQCPCPPPSIQQSPRKNSEKAVLLCRDNAASQHLVEQGQNRCSVLLGVMYPIHGYLRRTGVQTMACFGGFLTAHTPTARAQNSTEAQRQRDGKDEVPSWCSYQIKCRLQWGRKVRIVFKQSDRFEAPGSYSGCIDS